MKSLRHSTASVESKNIGKSSYVWQYTVILKGAIVGENCNINCHCFIENNVVIGNNVTVKSGVYIWDGARIQDDVFIGPNVTFSNNMRPRSKHKPIKHESATLMKGSSIGAGAVLVGNVTVGQYAMIGAGSVVTKDVPANNLWFGNPARFHAYVCTCGHKLNKKLICSVCHKKYKAIKGNIHLA